MVAAVVYVLLRILQRRYDATTPSVQHHGAVRGGVCARQDALRASKTTAQHTCRPTSTPLLHAARAAVSGGSLSRPDDDTHLS